MGDPSHELPILLVREVVHELREKDDVPGFVTELVGERVSRAVANSLAHALLGENRCRAFDGLGKIEDDRPQAAVAPAGTGRRLATSSPEIDPSERMPRW